jgi:hypothetical protein
MLMVTTIEFNVFITERVRGKENYQRYFQLKHARSCNSTKEEKTDIAVKCEID